MTAPLEAPSRATIQRPAAGGATLWFTGLACELFLDDDVNPRVVEIEHLPADVLSENDLGRLTPTVAETRMVDSHSRNPTTGALLLQGEPTGDALAAGLVRKVFA